MPDHSDSGTQDKAGAPVSRRDVIRGAVAATTAIGGVFGNASNARAHAFTLAPATTALAPFKINVPQAALVDLKRRLDMTRWPETQTVGNWSQGVPLEKMQELTNYWRTDYDWRRVEKAINGFPQFRTEIDGLGIHFLHVRSPNTNALPIILTHGWPGSVIEFLNVLRPLTMPEAFGGSAADSFHVVVPSLPGFGFSDKPTQKGWNLPRIARAWAELMQRLGYRRWVAQGGDWGAGVTTALGHMKPRGLIGVHLNWPLVFPEIVPTVGLSAEEQRAVTAAAAFLTEGSGYFLEQSTRPQTVGYALADSPTGQAAWIYEKFQAWTDNSGDPESALTKDEMLDNISLYWLTDTAASSARIYWENFPSSFAGGRIDLPVGASIFPKEIYRAPRTWAEQAYPQLIYWNELNRGGHFAAFEQPELFVSELRKCFSKLR